MEIEKRPSPFAATSPQLDCFLTLGIKRYTLGLKNTERRSLMKLNRLIPMLPVRSMPASVEFYQNMLGFKVERRNDDWGWAMLCFDECRLMVDQSINAHPEAPRQSIVYLYPDNVVEYHKQVRKNGLAVPELEITFYGLTEFRISDPDGNRLWIGQNTSAGA
jgi:uncharacterized glyoxalase superfamily protein PhnB